MKAKFWFLGLDINQFKTVDEINERIDNMYTSDYIWRFVYLLYSWWCIINGVFQVLIGVLVCPLLSKLMILTPDGEQEDVPHSEKVLIHYSLMTLLMGVIFILKGITGIKLITWYKSYLPIRILFYGSVGVYCFYIALILMGSW